MLVKAYQAKNYVRFADVPLEGADVVCLDLRARTADVAITYPDTTEFDHYVVTRETGDAIIATLEARQAAKLADYANPTVDTEDA